MKQPAYLNGKVSAAFLILVVFVAVSAFAGGENRVGTNAAPELLIPVGARDIALGGSSIATSSGLEAIYWNPAGLARSQHSTNAMFSHMNYIADIGVDYVAVGASFEGFGTLGFSIKSISIGDIAVTTEDATDGTGEKINPTIVNLGLTYSRLLTDKISVGATANLISERFDRVSATGVAFNAGVQYSGLGGFNGLSFGVVVKNIGPQMQFDGDGLNRTGNAVDVLRPNTFYRVTAAKFELPSTIELGLAYTASVTDESALNFSSVFQNNNFTADEYKLGVEYGYNNMFFVRGGYGFSEKRDDPSSPLADTRSYIYGISAGAGLHYPVGSLDITFDYAFRAVEFLDDNHIFSLKLGF
jgi:hypothetical protein